MSTLFDICQELFSTTDLYSVLGVTRNASQQDIKKGYYKKSLQYHPDRSSDKDKKAATKRFQVISQVYNILSDTDHRAEYDETGSVGEDIILDDNKDWASYWRLLFPKITVKDIQKFSDQYKGSDDELQALKEAYIKAKGDMNHIMDNMMCSCLEDEPRFIQLIDDLIKEGVLPNFPAFSKEAKKKKTARHKKAQAEAMEANEEAKKMKLDGSGDSLMAAIAQRQAARAAQAENFFSQLESKYDGQAKTGKKGTKKSK